MSQCQLAEAMDMPTRGINSIVHGQRRISADTALRLARYFRHVGEILDEPAAPL
jgi:addiction module HigA family antidote